MAAHAILSASGAYRWLKCTPSAQLERQFPDEKSEYAAEGSFAHAFAELKLERYLQRVKSKAYHKRLKELEADSFYSKELVDYVESYTSFAAERISEAQLRSIDAVVLLEQRLDFSAWVTGGFGTGDLVIIADGTMEVIDLKYGKGVPVSAKNNPQMRLYGLGALSQFDCLYDIHTVRMTICQPRLDNISTEEMTVDELTKWAEEYLRPRAELAMAGQGEFVAGEHCRFCRARATCRARADYNLEPAKYDFQEPFLLTVEEIADVLARAAELVAWAKDIQDYALDQALNHGIKFPGWKLVEGRSNRKYADEEAAAKALMAAGYAEDTIYQKVLLGITAMEKTIGKKRFDELLKDLVIKPPGKPTLAPESDKRPEISSADFAAADFS